jgi:peptidoglycan/LPS O-acetylase OafA/YrhL
MNQFNTRKKLDSLTGLRGVLAGMVVFIHAILPVIDKNLDSQRTILTGFGHFGVSGFFILSGFILFHTYNNRKWNTRSFYLNRFARIYPLYIFSILISLPIDWVSPALNSEHKASSLLLTLFSLQSWFTFSWGRFNAPSWTISVEAFFYVMFPMCFFLKKKISRYSFYLFFLGVLIFTIYNWKNCGHRLPANRLAEFVLGMCLVDVVHSKFLPTRGVSWISTILIATGLFGHHLLGLSQYEYCWMPIFAATVICCLAKADLSGNSVWGNKQWILAGEISFGLYLLHAPIQRYTRQAYKFISGGELLAADNWVKVTYVIATSIISVIMAYYVWKWIEVPARSYLRKRFS